MLAQLTSLSGCLFDGHGAQGTHLTAKGRPCGLTPTCPTLGILTLSLETSSLRALPLASQMAYKESSHLQLS